jgi:hypothetical protein
MIFSEYVRLLYSAFLEDKGYLETLRKKIRSEEFNRDQMYDPAFQDALSIDPRNPDTFKNTRARFFPNIYNPESGVITYEERQDAKEKLRVIRECLSRRRRSDKHQKSQN